MEEEGIRCFSNLGSVIVFCAAYAFFLSDIRVDVDLAGHFSSRE